MMPPSASIIIPHHNDKERLALCLASLEQCSNRAAVEIIVVDNGQPSLDAAFAASAPGIRFLKETRKGAAHARNAGVQEAQGHILIFTDSDCQVAPDFLTKALEVGARHDLAGGMVQLTTQRAKRSNSVQAFEQVFAFNQGDYIENKGFSVTANLVTNIDTFRKVGPFRAGLSEDFDWCQRATCLGYTLVYQPDLIVRHPCRTSWDQLRSKWKRITAETYGIHQSRGKANALWIARAFLMPLSILAHMPRVLRSSALSTPQERVGALAMLARLRLWRMIEMIRVVWPRNSAETG